MKPGAHVPHPASRHRRLLPTTPAGHRPTQKDHHRSSASAGQRRPRVRYVYSTSSGSCPDERASCIEVLACPVQTPWRHVEPRFQPSKHTIPILSLPVHNLRRRYNLNSPYLSGPNVGQPRIPEWIGLPVDCIVYIGVSYMQAKQRQHISTEQAVLICTLRTNDRITREIGHSATTTGSPSEFSAHNSLSPPIR